MARFPEWISAEELYQMELVVMRMLDAFEDGFVSLKNLFLRPFFVKELYTDIMKELYICCFSLQSRECSEICIFDKLLFHMTLEEQARHVAPLVGMFKSLVSRHPSKCLNHREHLNICYEVWICTLNFTKLYFKLLRGNEDVHVLDTSGELVRFLEYVLNAKLVTLRKVLLYMDPIGLDSLLTCFSQRFHAYDTDGRNFMMFQLYLNRKSSAVFIRHGFKYLFDPVYYSIAVGRLIYKRLTTEELSEQLTGSRNLRLQLAMDILLSLLTKYGPSQELLCIVWQSLPDPFITPDELYLLMKPFVQGSLLMDACAQYRDFIPGVPQEKQPRSLKHLARLRTRESMLRAHRLSEKTIRSLGLPKTIEDYLWQMEAF